MTKKSAMIEAWYQAALPEARVHSTRMAQEIVSIADERCEAGRDTSNAAFAGLTGSLVMQTITITLASYMFKPGSKEGKDFLSHIYHEALRDALERWDNPDLADLSTRRSEG